MEIKRVGSQPSGKGPADWFTGTVRIDPLFTAPDPAFVAGASVTFEPGARTAWHTHPLGQTLIVTAGAGWAQRAELNPDAMLSLPAGSMRVDGYVLLQHGIRPGMPGSAVQRWMDRVPAVYRSSILDESGGPVPWIEDDEYCLAQLRSYASLMPMAQDARKPVFALTAADGAFGGHQQAAQRAFSDFRQLTRQVLGATGVLVG